MQEIILTPYAPVLMESTRALGYSLESAVADLLDNSISAGATSIDIQYRPWDNPYLYILDNGRGMSPDEITSAMRYGSSSPLDLRGANDLGRFGLGLKTASLSQCRCLTVVSRKGGFFSGRRWDLDFINTRKDWVLLELDQTKIDEMPGVCGLSTVENGTLVIWHALDRLSAGSASLEDSFSKKMDRVRNHLSLVFHRYLMGEKGQKPIGISINRQPVVPVDPFLTTKSEQPMDEEHIIVDGHRISVTPYIIPHVSRLSRADLEALGGEEGLRRKQGFYVYRSRRLLVGGTWFRLLRQDALFKLARVKVDIPNSLDHLWTLDIRKSTVSPPEVVLKNLRPLVRRIADSSRRTWTFRGRKETTDEINHVWNRVKTREGIRYSINRNHPSLDALISEVTDHARLSLERILNTIESSIPLNQLYVDLTEDEHFAPDPDALSIIRQMALDIVRGSYSKPELGRDVFSVLATTEPFCNYPDALTELKNEVQRNG